MPWGRRPSAAASPMAPATPPALTSPWVRRSTPQGCITYKVTLNDATYTPAPSTCAVYPKYAQPAPTPQYRLAYKANNAPVVRTPPGGLGGNDNEFPHYTPAVAPKCQ